MGNSSLKKERKKPGTFSEPQGLKKVPGFGFQRLCGSFHLTQKGKMLTMRFHAVLSGEPEETPLVVSCTSLKVTLALRAT